MEPSFHSLNYKLRTLSLSPLSFVSCVFFHWFILPAHLLTLEKTILLDYPYSNGRWECESKSPTW